MSSSPIVNVGEVLLRIEAGRSVKTQERPARGGELGILKVSAVTWGTFRPQENKATLVGYEPGDCPRPRNGDLLISRANTRELVGAPVIVDGNHPNLLLSDKILRLVPDEKRVDRRYLARALRSTPARRHFERRAGGTSGSMTNITQDDIRAVPIPLPPLPEQRRIADILDKADAIRRKRKEAIALTEQLLRSTFLEMFGDPVTNPKGWPVKPLGTMVDIASGVTKGKKYGDQKMVTLPYMRVANVQDGHLVLDEVKTVTVSTEEGRRYRLLCGDVLLTEGGDPDKLGRGAVWRGEISDCIHQNHIFRLRPNDEIRSEYLSSIVGSERGKRYFLRAAKQTTGIASINMTQLRAFPVLVPPIPLQEGYGLFVSKLEGVRERLREKAVLLDHLFGALEQDAFCAS